MKLRLVKDAKIRHKAGEIVEVSPVDADFLIAVRAAVRVEAEPAAEQKKKARKK